MASYRYNDGWSAEYQEQCEEALLQLLHCGYAYCLIARRKGEYAGFLSYSWGFSTTKGLLILRIQDVYTAPAHRKAGVAGALLNHVVGLARKRGANRLQLETDTNNTAARALYSKIGFEWISHKEVYMFPLTRWSSE